MSAILDSPAWTTAHAMDGLESVRQLRIATEVREVEWLARLDGDLNPYGHSGDPELDRHFVVEDVACALRIPSVVAAAKLHVAGQLVTRFPAALAAMRAGHADLRIVSRLVELAAHLPDEALARFEPKALVDVRTATLARFTARTRRLVAAADTRDADAKHRADRAERRVVFTPVENGMTELWALLPSENAAALETAVRQLADRGTTDRRTDEEHTSDRRTDDEHTDDERTADQRRADALCELATGGHGLRPQITVTVAASTLLGLDDQPAELDGSVGPTPLAAATARALAADVTGTWRRILTDPAGRMCDSTSHRYRPPAAMTRFVQLRDRTCRFPTCRRRATRCEIDHVRNWADGGSTTPGNLIALCSRHHHLKHDGRWRVRRESDGAVTWTTPTGHRHRTPPPDPPPRCGQL